MNLSRGQGSWALSRWAWASVSFPRHVPYSHSPLCRHTPRQTRWSTFQTRTGWKSREILWELPVSTCIECRADSTVTSLLWIACLIWTKRDVSAYIFSKTRDHARRRTRATLPTEIGIRLFSISPQCIKLVKNQTEQNCPNIMKNHRANKKTVERLKQSQIENFQA